MDTILLWTAFLLVKKLFIVILATQIQISEFHLIPYYVTLIGSNIKIIRLFSPEIKVKLLL